MPIFARDGRTVLFVHVPKTGGTSVERLFVRSGWEMTHRATARTDPATFHTMRCSPQHYHGAMLEQMFRVDRFDAVFLITRDPVPRFRSEYVMRNAKDPRTDAASVEQWAEAMLDRYAADPFVLDNHLRPQADYLVEGATVYRLEDGLEAMVADLNARHGLELRTKVPRSLHSNKRAGISSSEVEVSPALTARLAELYRVDYERFGYPVPPTA